MYFLVCCRPLSHNKAGSTRPGTGLEQTGVLGVEFLSKQPLQKMFSYLEETKRTNSNSGRQISCINIKGKADFRGVKLFSPFFPFFMNQLLMKLMVVMMENENSRGGQ